MSQNSERQEPVIPHQLIEVPGHEPVLLYHKEYHVNEHLFATEARNRNFGQPDMQNIQHFSEAIKELKSVHGGEISINIQFSPGGQKDSWIGAHFESTDVSSPGRGLSLGQTLLQLTKSEAWKKVSALQNRSLLTYQHVMELLQFLEVKGCLAKDTRYEDFETIQSEKTERDSIEFNEISGLKRAKISAPQKIGINVPFFGDYFGMNFTSEIHIALRWLYKDKASMTDLRAQIITPDWDLIKLTNEKAAIKYVEKETGLVVTY